jgi:hypothetical protein
MMVKYIRRLPLAVYDELLRRGGTGDLIAGFSGANQPRRPRGSSIAYPCQRLLT